MKKPFLFVLVAAIYIIVLVLTANTLGSILQTHQDNLLMPITGLGVFVLSAAVMGFLFLSEPLKLFLENRKQEAALFFGKTIGIFACFVVIFAILIFMF